jgi:hypothetical protein
MVKESQSKIILVQVYKDKIWLKTGYLLPQNTECPRTRGSNLKYVFHDGNKGKKCIEK